MGEERLGKQTPTISIRLSYTESLGTEAVALYNSSDRTAQPWQALMTEDIMAVTPEELVNGFFQLRIISQFLCYNEITAKQTAKELDTCFSGYSKRTSGAKRP